MIGNINDKQTLRSSHKYGFKNAEDFLMVTKAMSKYYKDFTLKTNKRENVIPPPSSITPEMSRLVPIVFAARQLEVTRHFEHWEYSKTQNILEYFGWDTRLILGDSRFGGNFYQQATVNLSFRHLSIENALVFQINTEKLDEIINVLEKSLAQSQIGRDK
ncbi:uncharacterized protein LOC108091717 isoform X2 [Drosophila ficusphila]|nr:uncharacterized protein LOC108091717 isoform X2 [Drosophila ficusphila]